MNENLIRFGCHSFLNARPLIDPIIREEIPHRFKVILDVPSKLSDMMREGKMDIGWIPSIEYARMNDCLIMPDMSISSYKSVKSVVLISKVKIEKLTSVALDTDSRTSVVMLKILLRRYGIMPEFLPMPPSIPEMMGIADAALIIGDNALRAKKDGFIVYDLSEEWFRFTGLPFVHALLLVRKGISLGDQREVLFMAREKGISSVNRIIDEESERLGISKDMCRDYFEKRIIYRLGAEELEGLKTFYFLAKREGFLDKEPGLMFYE